MGRAEHAKGKSHRNEWEGAGLEPRGVALIERAGLVSSESS